MTRHGLGVFLQLADGNTVILRCGRNAVAISYQDPSPYREGEGMRKGDSPETHYGNLVYYSQY